MGSLYFRALCSILADVSMAALCGLLMARVWLRRGRGLLQLPPLALPAATFAVAVALQLLALTASFTGQSSMTGMLASLPDILATHPGKVLGLTLLAATLLLAVAVLSRNGRRFAPVLAVLFVLCVVLRAGSGHAATEEMMSLSQTLQCLHLAGMAVWGGGVMVSGLLVLPRLRGSAEQFRGYVASLSTSSTWAVCVTAFAGLGKTWTAVAGNLPLAWRGGWALVLMLKIVCVCAAIVLGLLNRRLLVAQEEWAPSTQARSAALLRAEAVAMVAILMISGILANLPPPGE